MRPRDWATDRVVTDGAEGSYVGNCSKVAGWTGEVRVGRRWPAGTPASVVLVGKRGEGGSDEGESTLETV